MFCRYLVNAIVAASAAFILFTSASCTYSGPPAHGHRWHDHDYFYYPGVEVYYHIHTGYYYYRSGGAWLKVRQLPRHIHIQRRSRVQIRVDDRHPYARYKEHRNRYKSKEHHRTEPRHDREERQYNNRRHKEYSEQLEKKERRKEKSDKRSDRRREKYDREKEYKEERKKRQRDLR